MKTKFEIGAQVRCNGNDQGRIVAVDSWDGIIFYTIRLWDGFRIVGETQMSEGALLNQQERN
jgi:hypothetical protein